MGQRYGWYLVVLLGGLVVPAVGDDWPQWHGPQRDGVYRETGVVQQVPAQLQFKWKTPIGMGYAGPAVADGKVFVTDRILSTGQANPDDPFKKTPVNGSERVHCLDATTGAIRWTHTYPCNYTISYPYGPRATPTVDEDRVYTLGAMGDLFCLNTETGQEIWHLHYVKDFNATVNTWGMSGAPLVDGEQLILLVGGKPNALVVAVDRRTGKERWRQLESEDPGYCAPRIIEVGGVRQLIIWAPTFLASLNPENGAVYWRIGHEPINFGMTISSPAINPAEDLIFVTSFYEGAKAVKLLDTAPEAQWLYQSTSKSEQKTEMLHSIISSPIFRDGKIYGVCSYGQLRCLEAQTGQRLWETFAATGEGRWWTAFLTPVGETGNTFYLANEQGELISAQLTANGYQETGRAPLIAPTGRAQRRKIVWSHPAYAQKSIFARNDEEIVCANLDAESYKP